MKLVVKTVEKPKLFHYYVDNYPIIYQIKVPNHQVQKYGFEKVQKLLSKDSKQRTVNRYPVVRDFLLGTLNLTIGNVDADNSNSRQHQSSDSNERENKRLNNLHHTLKFEYDVASEIQKKENTELKILNNSLKEELESLNSELSNVKSTLRSINNITTAPVTKKKRKKRTNKKKANSVIEEYCQADVDERLSVSKTDCKLAIKFPQNYTEIEFTTTSPSNYSHFPFLIAIELLLSSKYRQEFRKSYIRYTVSIAINF